MTRLSADVIKGFTNSCLRKYFDGACDTPACHVQWWDACTSNHKRVAIAAPRGFAKSTAITHCYGLATVLFRERDYVIIVSDTTTQAVQFLGDWKKELLDNEDIKELFGVEEFIKDTEDDIIVRLNDGHEFRVQAKGAEQKLRGLKWKNKRPNLILVDDLENDELVLNKERRTKLKRWFYGALLPCLSDDGIVRVAGTILHLDSLLESLMPAQLLTGRAKDLIQEELVEYTNAKLPWKSYKYKAHNQDFSHLLWKEKRPKEDLLRIREDYIRQGLSDVYSQEYLNVPLDEARTFFKRVDFHPITDIDKKRRLNYYISCDLAVSSKQRADYTVFIVGGVDEDGVLHIRNVIRDRLDAQEIVETILSLQELYKPLLFSIEEGAISKAIGPFLNETMLRRGIFPNLRLMKPTQDKLSRAHSIQARMRAGGVKFDKGAEWFLTFEDELLKFPKDKHDDQVDAFAYLGLIADRMTDAETDQEAEDEEYDIFQKKHEADSGRSQVTGY